MSRYEGMKTTGTWHQNFTPARSSYIKERKQRYGKLRCSEHFQRDRSGVRATSAPGETTQTQHRNNNDSVNAPHTSRPGRVVVIGAGPGGSIAALALARQGYTVDVYERRPEPKQDEIDIRRSYIIALSKRGITALKEKGIQIQDQAQARYLGTVTKRFKGKPKVSPAEPGSVCFDRFELAQFLIDETQRLVPGKIRYHFQYSLENINFDKRTIILGHPHGNQETAEYDLLIAADGVNSEVRTRLAGHSEEFTASIEDSGREFKTFRGMKSDTLEPAEWANKEGRSIHLFLGNNSLTSLSCRRNTDGSYSGTFALKNGEFEKLDMVQDYEQLIRRSLRGIPKDWPPEIAKQCAYAPTNSNGKRVRCSELHGPGVIFVGDAAHAVTPIGGQGCNAALEDGSVLEWVVAETGGDLQKVPEAWTKARWKDARALVNIESSFYKLVGGRKLGVLDPAFLRLVAHIVIGSLLHKIMPWWFKPPALAQLGSPLPYSVIEQRVNRDAIGTLLVVVSCITYVALKVCKVL